MDMAVPGKPHTREPQRPTWWEREVQAGFSGVNEPAWFIYKNTNYKNRKRRLQHIFV